jgi:hypothetical protein
MVENQVHENFCSKIRNPQFLDSQPVLIYD